MDTTPSEFLILNMRWFFIHSSSPNEQQYRSWSKQLNLEVYYMVPWNWDKVVASRRFCMAGGFGTFSHDIFAFWNYSPHHIQNVEAALEIQYLPTNISGFMADGTSMKSC
ncbi:hypothetical protein BGX38DRAFT_477694 [Terfezia claveryi]|nr:hypothetical protein BGX38DRAFT_477694 [Terfezia claveryi]